MSAAAAISPAELVGFWREAGPDKWFAKDDAFDQAIRDRFGTFYAEAASGGHDKWAASAEGALALVLLFDQFSRNLFRGSAETYAQDAKARAIAAAAIDAGFDTATDRELRRFFYLPFMHSEGLADQVRSVALNHALGEQESLRYARHHHDIVRRFGRFPHRNRMLGRHTTPAEQAFLDAGGFGG